MHKAIYKCFVAYRDDIRMKTTVPVWIYCVGGDGNFVVPPIVASIFSVSKKMRIAITELPANNVFNRHVLFHDRLVNSMGRSFKPC